MAKFSEGKSHVGNVEGVDLENNSQSTTHIDPLVGTGGMLRVLAYDFWKGGKILAPACSVSDKGPGLRLKLLLMFQLNPQSTCSLHNPSQVRFLNMCHFHG